MIIEQLTSYFSSTGRFAELGLRNLSKNYSWPKKGKFPSYAHFSELELKTGTNFEKNIHLKQVSPKIWEGADKFQLSNWIVRDWGGIRGNKAGTLQRYLDAISNDDFPACLTGVASYSKILSFMNPQTFAIYDARVAISLNAIQLLSETREGRAFCYLPGRNTALQKFRQVQATHITSLVSRGWQQVEPDNCYRYYLEVLEAARDGLKGAQLYQLEMSLFADAENLAEMYLQTQS